MLKKKYRKKLNEIIIKFLNQKPKLKKFELPLVETQEIKDEKSTDEEIMIKEIHPNETNSKKKEIGNEDSSTHSESNENVKNKKNNNSTNGKKKSENENNKSKTESPKAKKEVVAK